MGNFCKHCGRPLQEGEVCNCTQQNNVREQVAQQQPQQQAQYQQPVYQQPTYQQQPQQQAFKQPQYNQGNQYPVPKKGVPKMLVPISQIVAGSVLILEGVYTMGFAWSEISFITAAGFLITGICGLIDAKK